MCAELWDFAEDGERYYEKIVHSFLPALYEHWKRLGTKHVVTVVLMSRVYYDATEVEYAAGPIRQDETGRQFKDFFKVETDLEVVTDWKPVLNSLKESFFVFQRDILLNHHFHTATKDGRKENPRLVGKISYAHDGPLLEALNLALQPTEMHYIDRTLSLTGTATIIVTPGKGHFRVSKRLLQLTTTRLLDQGFGVSVVCLGRAPLHITPLFSFYGLEPSKFYRTKAAEPQGGREYDVLWGGDDEDNRDGHPDRTVLYWQPFWMTLMFWDLQMDQPYRADKYVPPSFLCSVRTKSLSGIFLALACPSSRCLDYCTTILSRPLLFHHFKTSQLISNGRARTAIRPPQLKMKRPPRSWRNIGVASTTTCFNARRQSVCLPPPLPSTAIHLADIPTACHH